MLVVAIEDSSDAVISKPWHGLAVLECRSRRGVFLPSHRRRDVRGHRPGEYCLLCACHIMLTSYSLRG